MDARYTAWVELHVPNREAAYCKCAEVTLEMRSDFPELTRVRGQYQCAHWGKRAHWWLTAPSGYIVDPTKSQFPDQNGTYAAHTGPEPTRKCLYCGEYCYGLDYFCSDACRAGGF